MHTRSKRYLRRRLRRLDRRQFDGGADLPPGRQSLFATDADESLQPLGTLIGDIFQLWTQILNRHQY
jgi:hypothetical protein